MRRSYATTIVTRQTGRSMRFNAKICRLTQTDYVLPPCASYSARGSSDVMEQLDDRDRRLAAAEKGLMGAKV
jgi:hypothetical protein